MYFKCFLKIQQKGGNSSPIIIVTVVINIVNFYRLLISDFIRPDKEKTSSVECRLTSDALDQAIKDSDGSNGFHPVTKDVNRLVTSLFNPDDEGSNQGQPPLADDQTLAKKFK